MSDQCKMLALIAALALCGIELLPAPETVPLYTVPTIDHRSHHALYGQASPAAVPALLSWQAPEAPTDDFGDADRARAQRLATSCSQNPTLQYELPMPQDLKAL